MKVNKGQLVIDVSDIDKLSFEALIDFAEEYDYLPIGKLIRQWIDNVEWDVAAWYIGDDL